MSKRIELYEIEWDIEDEDDENAACLDLPDKVVVEVNRRWNPDDEAADYLSDNFGFCVNGCKWRELC